MFGKANYSGYACARYKFFGTKEKWHQVAVVQACWGMPSPCGLCMTAHLKPQAGGLVPRLSGGLR